MGQVVLRRVVFGERCPDSRFGAKGLLIRIFGSVRLHFLTAVHVTSTSGF